MLMHDFHYGRDGELRCESVRIREIAEHVGTPFYLYSHKTLTEHLLKLKAAFRPADPLICFSMKANGNLAVLRSLVKSGAGLDIVSGGELFRARQAGCPPSKIVYAGVGKTKSEIEEAVRARILLFNAESAPELESIDSAAGKLKERVRVSLRINPEVDSETHRHIATAGKESKFGLDLASARDLFLAAGRYRNLRLRGIHVHIGSQIVRGEPFVKAFRKVLIFIADLGNRGAEIEYLNLGGGLGIIYSDERPQTAGEFARRVLPLLTGRKLKLILEPGRFIVGNSGIFVTRILYVKETRVKRFAIVDGGMNDLIRPALYGSFHDVWPARRGRGSQRHLYDVVGPICESGDFLARNRKLAELKAGDLLGIASAGAYGFTMSSNYNARPRACEILARGNRFSIARERETYRDLIRGEKIPSWV